MKNTFLKIGALLLVWVTGMAVSCEDKPYNKEHYPVDITTTAFSLPDGCLQNLTPDSVYLINSQEDLAHYPACLANRIEMLGIDLTKYTLIILSPMSCNIDSRVERISLQQESANEYLLSVDVISALTANAAPLIISFVAPKLAGNTKMELTINMLENSCNCIMDTLQGVWEWVKGHGGSWGAPTNIEYSCIIKILSQNADASINYEVFVEDTLYYSESFQYQYGSGSGIIATTNINLPYYYYYACQNWNWYIFYGNVDTLRFWDGCVDGYIHYFKKIN